jgi:hypothetical protein
MKPWHVVANVRWAARALGWSALMVVAILFALLLQSLAASALVAPRSAEPPSTCQSTAGAALADGDDVRARFVANLCPTALAEDPNR